MKFIIPSILALCTLGATAQQNVRLQIEHFLNDVPTAVSDTTTNNLGEVFTVRRMEYYMSQITLIHDGGQRTAVADTWLLVDAGGNTDELMGSFNITYLEGIQFGIGVEQAVNHLDPASYPMSHPLAPKSPSMHWGWSPGYRFVAMEGHSGAGMNQTYEIHALGDVNYFMQTIPTVGINEGNDLVVSLNANYAEAVRSISVANGSISHGETGIAVDLLVNFNQHVFTSSEGNAAVLVSEIENTGFLMYPNPTDGSTRLVFDTTAGAGKVVIHDALGRTVKEVNYIGGGTMDVSLTESGVYQVQLVREGRSMFVQSLVVH